MIESYFFKKFILFFSPVILKALFILMLFHCREKFGVHTKCNNQKQANCSRKHVELLPFNTRGKCM